MADKEDSMLYINIRQEELIRELEKQLKDYEERTLDAIKNGTGL